MRLGLPVRDPAGLHPGTIIMFVFLCCAGEVRLPPRRESMGLRVRGLPRARVLLGNQQGLGLPAGAEAKTHTFDRGAGFDHMCLS